MLQLEEAVTPLQAQAEQTAAQAEALQRQVALLRKDYRQIADVLSGI